MDLHRTGKHSQWKSVPPGERNAWQRIALHTSGVVTPGNITSVIGAIFVATGLTYVYQGTLALGLLFLGVGRLADVADGALAAKTRTKSPLGEAVDASIDKLSMLAALIVLVAAGVVPVWAIMLIALINGVTVILSVAARYKKRLLHPSMVGKFATALQWAAFMLYVAAELLRNNDYHAWGGLIAVAGGITVIVSLLAGIAAISGYAHAAFTRGK